MNIRKRTPAALSLLRSMDLPVLLAAALCVVHFASFEIAHGPIVWDTRFYLYFASRFAHGEVPYRDFFEFKMPLSIFVGGFLHRVGLLVGLEPLHVIRAGYLTLAAAAGFVLFAVHRRLDSGRAASGFLALAAYLAFPLLGLLPAIGVCPKTLVALFAPLAALGVAHRRFYVAGACGALAFFDWQVGGLAALGAFAGALATRGVGVRSAGRVSAGFGLAAAPVAAYFVITGGMSDMLGQTLGTLLDRGEEVSHRTLPESLAVIVDSARVACPGQEWLLAIAVAGMLIYPLWLWRRRDDETFGMAVALGTYHYGLVAFSLFDFQSYFDLYILICTMAFFAGVALAEALNLVLRAANPSRGRLIESAAVAIAIVVARPASFGARPDLAPPTIEKGGTLEDQKQVALKVVKAVGGRRVAFLGAAEVAYLTERESAAPFVYWDTVAYRYFRHEGEEYGAPRDRLLSQYGAEVLVGDRTLPPEPGDVLIRSDNRAYWVTLRPIH